MRLKLAVVLLVGLMLAPPALATSWSEENANAANEGRLARAGPGSLSEPAFTSLDERVLAQVTEGPAGLALAGTLAGTVQALDASGETVWSADVGDEIRNAPLWTGEHVVVLPRGGQAHAFTAMGEPAWTVDVDNDRGATLVRMASPIQHPSGDVILATMAGNVHRVTPEGSIAWTAEIGDSEAIEATPAITSEGDVVAAAFEPGRDEHGLVARLDGSTGEEVWVEQTGAQVVGAPTVLAGTVLVPLRDGNALEARSLSDGSQRWETAFDARVTASPTLHDGKAILGDIRGNLRALDVSGGQEAWSFHPSGDDPEVNALQSATYTVADSVAVDDDGVAWASYWVADLNRGDCCPPQHSTQSPIYRLDAGDGELLDRQEHPKANHGPSLHATGVWTGSDEEGIRHWSTGPSLQIHAQAANGVAQLVTNTDRSGSWQIAWDGDVVDEGEDSPPPLTTTELEPGRHTVTVTVDGDTAQDAVFVEDTADSQTDDGEDEAEDPDDEEPAAGQGETEGDEAQAPEDAEEAPDAIGFPALASLVGVLVAVGVRARA